MRRDYLTRRGEPRTPADLCDHDCIAFEELQRHREWPFSGANGIEQIAIGARFSVNTADGVIGGAIAGLGIARVLSYQAADGVRSGTLLPILTEWAQFRREDHGITLGSCLGSYFQMILPS